MTEILRFKTNIPEEVALRFADGKEVQSRIEGAPNQMMYSLADGRVTYVPLHVAERIRELNIQPSQRFTICKAEVKNGQRRRIEWQVNRVDPDPRWQDENGVPYKHRPEPTAHDHGNGNGAAAQVQGSGSDPGNRQSTTPQPASDHATHNGIPYWDPETEMVRCYEVAIKVAMTAEKYAAERNYSLRFSSDDVRQIAATLFIDAGKDRRCPNGGAR